MFPFLSWLSETRNYLLQKASRQMGKWRLQLSDCPMVKASVIKKYEALIAYVIEGKKTP